MPRLHEVLAKIIFPTTAPISGGDAAPDDANAYPAYERDVKDEED
ncbi:TPA: hypothetical protein ACIPUI_002992 [Citrobacter freundii]